MNVLKTMAAAAVVVAALSLGALADLNEFLVKGLVMLAAAAVIAILAAKALAGTKSGESR